MDSNARVSMLTVQLMQGAVVNTDAVIAQYQISERTFYRDLHHIKCALAESQGTEATLIEGPARHWRIIRQNGQDDLSVVLALCHIVLGSRALVPEELQQALACLQARLSTGQQETLKNNLRQARQTYLPLTNPRPLLPLIQQITEAIAQRQKLTFSYLSSQTNLPTQPQIHHAQPVAIFFEAHYFYAAMYSDERQRYWLYRLDRMQAIHATEPGAKLDYATRFSLQDHRRQTYLLAKGDAVLCRFRYTGYANTALDHFPSAKVIRRDADGSVVIEIYVKIEGALFWLLGQGPRVKVLSPPLLVQLMAKTLDEMRAQY